jgi:ribosomal protein S18 acetylase RimI-like enzyme
MTQPPPGAIDTWRADPATTLDYPFIADFLATTNGLGGRSFAADSRDIAEHLDGVFPGTVTVIRDQSGRIRGYTALFRPRGREPQVRAQFVFDPLVPPDAVDVIVGGEVERFHREAAAIPAAFLRVIVEDGSAAVAALTRRGAWQEAEFIGTRKALGTETVSDLESAAIGGVTVLTWPGVIGAGIDEQVRQLQYDTFIEHFGDLSKSPEQWRHHLASREFAPDFSFAAIDTSGDLVGYVLGSQFTRGPAPSEELSAHTQYIGVRSDLRRTGIAELLLKKVWAAALRRGLSVASLGTDVRNRTHAHLLYRRLGYLPVEHEFAYRIDFSEDPR